MSFYDKIGHNFGLKHIPIYVIVRKILRFFMVVKQRAFTINSL